MKFKINFGTRAAAIPCSVSELLDRASELDLKVIIYMCTVLPEASAEEISKALGYSVDEINMSLAFLRGAGVIVSDSSAKSITKKARTEKKNEPEKVIAEGQNILGKIFTVHEVNVLIGLSDYLGLENDFIIMLLKHCAEMGKKTLHYVEKTAISLYDMGITTVAALSAELERREALSNMEGHIRRIFGIGSRNLTTKEKREISAWVNDMKCPVEVIEKAYEVTCDATGKPSIHYANSVIERWHAEGLLTIDQIEASYKEKSADGTSSSFETDEFFEAAVRRSLGEK